MTQHFAQGSYGELTAPMTLKIERVLPGPIERVWAYLTDSDLRRQWLAAGDMDMKVGAPVTLVWNNDALTKPAGKRPADLPCGFEMQCRITALDPLKKLAITWGNSDGVTFELAPRGNKVLLTVTHHRLAGRGDLLNVSAGWHMHLDVLAARLSGAETEPFWDGWNRLKSEYDKRIPPA